MYESGLEELIKTLEAGPCKFCGGDGWVCEVHPDKTMHRCCGFEIGMPCVCNPEASLPDDYVSIASTKPGSRMLADRRRS